MLFGGRFTNSDESVFMSVGEQRYDRSGYPKISKIALSEQKNPYSVFGTILEFDKKLTGFNIYSRGHRNAQGMFFSATSKKFYEAEHGPQGGDEVNIVLKGKNYGWPFVSFGIPYGWQVASGFPDPATVKGTNYEQVLKKSGQVRGTHEGYQKPLFSWFPSVGAGSLLQVASDSDLLDWRDNLLVVSLTSNQLHRLILEGDKVIFDEKIDVGARIRDMLVTRSGDLVIALDEGTLLAYRP
jgi:glucose/arabinose dehydrogenase